MNPIQPISKPDGIPSFEKAQAEANKGNLYCWLCGSDHVVKQSKVQAGRLQFKCRDCLQYFAYIFTDEGFAKLQDNRKKKKEKKE